jgi:hypothetical protein
MKIKKDTNGVEPELHKQGPAYWYESPGHVGYPDFDEDVAAKNWNRMIERKIRISIDKAKKAIDDAYASKHKPTGYR